MPSIADLKQQYPDLNDLDDEQVVDVVHETFYKELPREEVAKSLGVKPAPAQVEPRSMMRVAGDVGISALKGAIGVPEAAVGLADLATGGRAGKAAEDLGFRPKETKAMLDAGYSDQQKEAFRQVQAADGLGETFMAAVRNPSVVGHSVVESLPSMGAGGVLARGGVALAPKLGAVAAGALGEGVVGAGGAAEQIRQQSADGLLTGTQAGLAGATGVLTTGFGMLGGKIAKKLGIADVDTMLAGASTYPAMRKGVVRSALEGAVSEGILEELPQSVAEQVLQNIALDKPIDEGVNQAAVLGLLSGATMGGGANVLSSFGGEQPGVTPAAPVTPAGPLTRATSSIVPGTTESIAAANQPAPVEPVDDPVLDTINSLPDGIKQQALRAYAVLNRPDVAKGVRSYNQKLLDGLLDQVASDAEAGLKKSENQPPTLDTQGPAAIEKIAPQTEAINPDTGEITSAYEQRQADAPKQLPDDILNAQNKPFTNMGAAKKTAQALGDGFAPFKLGTGAFVVRKQGATDASTSTGVPAVAATASGGGSPVASGSLGAGNGAGNAAVGAMGAGDVRAQPAGPAVSGADRTDDKAVDVQNTPPATAAKTQTPAGQAPEAGAPAEAGAAAAGTPGGNAALEAAGVDVNTVPWRGKMVPRANIEQVRRDKLATLRQVKKNATASEGTPNGEGWARQLDETKAFLKEIDAALAGNTDANAPADTKAAAAKRIADMSDAELTALKDHYGPEHKRTPKILKEIEKRSSKQPTDQATSTQDAIESGASDVDATKESNAAPKAGAVESQGGEDVLDVQSIDGAGLADAESVASGVQEGAAPAVAAGDVRDSAVEGDKKSPLAPDAKVGGNRQPDAAPAQIQGLPMFSRKAQEAQALKALSENDELFALPKSDSKTVEGIAADNAQGIIVKKMNYPGLVTTYDLTMPDGARASIMVRKVNPYGEPQAYGLVDREDGEFEAIIDRPGSNPENIPDGTEDVYIDVSKLKEGGQGRLVYNIAATFAHNTDRILIGDPAGLSNAAMRRRTEHMLSSALKFGTTRHLAPHPRQTEGAAGIGVPPLRWTYGDDLDNIKSLIKTSTESLENAGGNPFTFNPTDGTFRDSEGGAIDGDGISLVATLGSGKPGKAGRATLQRSAVLSALLREQGKEGSRAGQRDGLLGRLLEWGREHSVATKGIFYSRGDSASGDTNSVEASAATAEVERIVQGITSRWANAPKVVVAHDMQDPRIPERVRLEDQKQRSNGATGTPEGFYLKGTTYLMSSQLTTPQDIARVLFHESLGHFGLRGTFGDQLKPILQQLAALRRTEVAAKAKQYGLDMGDESQRLQAAEEVLAEMAQTRPEIGFVKRAIVIIRTWLRRNIPGFKNLALTDADIINNYILPARGFVERGQQADGAASFVPAFARNESKVPPDQQGRAQAATKTIATETPAFRKWFGDSKVVDEAGKPLVVYHGTTADFSEYRPSKNGAFGSGIYFTDSTDGAESYAALTGEPGANVMPVFLQIENPLRLKEWEIKGDMASSGWKKRIRDGGYDGLIVERDEGDFTYVAFRPEQIKSVFNNGDFDSTNPDIRFSRSSAAALTRHATDKLNETFSHPGRMSIWDKTVGSMYNLAERNAPFKQVFTAAQDFISDVSYYGTEAADMAPKILPKLDAWRDMLKTPISAEDGKAIEAPINQGTLSWARDEAGKPVAIDDLQAAHEKLTFDEKAQMLLRKRLVTEDQLKRWKGSPLDVYEGAVRNRFDAEYASAGVVWTNAELESMFSLNPAQIALYREFRAAVDKSLDNLAKADLLRFGGKDVVSLRDMVMEAKDADEAAELLRDYLMTLAGADKDRSDALNEAAAGMIDRSDKVKKLKARGYAPLSRFGRYSVDVVVDGDRQYFGLFETARDANLMAGKMRSEFGKDNVAQGTMSQKEFEQFQGITPESIELFGNMLGLDSTGDDAQDQAFQAYLRLTKNNRSAMKRMIHRKGIAGYNTDVGRVLAAFVYSNARQTSAALHMGEIAEAIQEISKTEGEIKDAAIELASYIKQPREEAHALRGLLFAQYLGGSIASAFVNFTQPLTVSFPYLSQYGGAAKAGAALLKAMTDQRAGVKLETDLAEALRLAEEKGTVSPQSVHELMAQAQGRAALRSGDGTRTGETIAFAKNNFAKLALGWGKLFGLAEQVNRRSTFIAAFRIAVEQKIANPATFATKAVHETQFISNKANKAKFARGAIGGTLMTFKSYSVNYLELLHRMATQNGPEGKKAALLMLGMLMLMAGAGGLPFADDLGDAADFLAQRLGYNFSSKKAKQEFLENLFGKEMAGFVDKGISGLPGSPLDVSGRMSMSNLIPGTGLLLKKRSHTSDIGELFGPAGDLVKRTFQAGDHMLSGNVAKAALTIAPKAVYNAAKGFDMAGTGAYNDDKGFKVIETTPFEAALKAVGFQPAGVADVQQASYLNQRAKDFYSLNVQEINATWAKALYERDPGGVARARDMVATWNEQNPDQKIKPNMPAILKRVREMSKSKEQRVADTAPKAMRVQMRLDMAERLAAQP